MPEVDQCSVLALDAHASVIEQRDVLILRSRRTATATVSIQHASRAGYCTSVRCHSLQRAKDATESVNATKSVTLCTMLCRHHVTVSDTRERVYVLRGVWKYVRSPQLRRGRVSFRGISPRSPGALTSHCTRSSRVKTPAAARAPRPPYQYAPRPFTWVPQSPPLRSPPSRHTEWAYDQPWQGDLQPPWLLG
jgi:hypothetical protein